MRSPRTGRVGFQTSSFHFKAHLASWWLLITQEPVEGSLWLPGPVPRELSLWCLPRQQGLLGLASSPSCAVTQGLELISTFS